MIHAWKTREMSNCLWQFRYAICSLLEIVKTWNACQNVESYENSFTMIQSVMEMTLCCFYKSGLLLHDEK